MAIEINGVSSPHVQSSNDGARVSSQTDGANSERKVDAQKSDDTVRLTDTAKQLSRLESQLNDVPVVDKQRVEEVRAAVETGNYEINAGNVSQKLMQFEAYIPQQ